MAAEKKYSGICILDDDGCVSLHSIVKSFNAPISEEQAWAVCYQTTKCFKKAWETDFTNCYCLTDTNQLFIHKDGIVPIKTAFPKKDFTSASANTEYKLVTSLGITLFHALDFGLCEDEERSLSPTLELLIDRMTSADPDDDAHADDSSSSDETASQNADEGIERDSGEDDPRNTVDGQQRGGLTLDRVLEMCSARLKSPLQADAHYRAVCRALVAEALELSTFLEKVSHGTKELLRNTRNDPSESNLDSLEVKDWARLWMQVIRQLRQGVKLKKVGLGNMPHRIEFELTPYEMLLDDIRSRRYKLNKVMVNGDIPPRVKKDAHALILEFIRSRPPLIPASKRKLRPLPPRQPTLYEKLMASLKQQHKLRPTTPDNKKDGSDNSDQEGDSKSQSNRRLIKVDLALRLSTSFGDDDDWDDMFQSPTDVISHISSPKDDIFQISENYIEDRRHSMPAFASSKQLSKENKPPLLKAHTLSDNHYAQDNTIASHNTSEYWKSSQWQSLECLSLTLEEVVHIRNVLTKAELESLLVVPSLYEDVSRGKICFTCKKTKFSFFGSWGVKCKLCERIVCSKCSTKMHIPTEQFANIPVYMLSPAPAPPDDLDNFLRKIPDTFKFSRNDHHQTSIELPDDSPIFEQKMKQSESFHALSVISAASDDSQPRKPPLLRSKTVHHRSEESLIDSKPMKSAENVCTDCKEMLCDIILTSQVADMTEKRHSRTWGKQRDDDLSATSSFVSTHAESPSD